MLEVIFEPKGIFMSKAQRSPKIIVQYFEQISASVTSLFNSASEQTAGSMVKAISHEIIQ
jgi:hypothetical protein